MVDTGFNDVRWRAQFIEMGNEGATEIVQRPGGDRGATVKSFLLPVPTTEWTIPIARKDEITALIAWLSLNDLDCNGRQRHQMRHSVFRAFRWEAPHLTIQFRLGHPGDFAAPLSRQDQELHDVAEWAVAACVPHGPDLILR